MIKLKQEIAENVVLDRSNLDPKKINTNNLSFEIENKVESLCKKDLNFILMEKGRVIEI